MSTTASPLSQEGGAPATGIWSRPYRSLTAGLLLTAVVAAFEQLSVATVLPAASRELDGLSLYGWVFSAFMLAMVISLPIGGGEVDSVGPWRPFLAGAALFGGGLGVAGFAPTMPAMIGGRVLQGFGAGLIASVLYATVDRAYPEEARPKMLALISSAYTLPSLIGPAVAGFVAEHIGWRWVFLGLMPLLPLSALACQAMRGLDRTRTQPPEWARVARSVRLALGVAITTLALERFSFDAENPWAAIAPVAATAVGVGLAIHALRGLLPSGKGASRLPAVVYTAILLNVGFFGVDAFLPLSLVEFRSISLSMAGLVLTAATISWITGAWIQARLAQRRSRRALVTAGLGFIGAGVIGLVALLWWDLGLWLAFFAWAVAGFGMGFASPTVTLVGMELSPPAKEGAGTSVITLAGILGIAVGTGLGGAIIGAANDQAALSMTRVALYDLLMVGAILWALVALVPRFPKGRRADEKAPR